MTLINPFVFNPSAVINTGRSTTQRAASVRDYTKLFQLNAEQQKKLREQSESEKQLREAARGGVGQGQAESLKRQMLYERLKLLLQQVALMDKQSAKAAMAEVKRIAGELRQMSAQATSTASSSADTEASNTGTQSAATTAAPQTPTIPLPGVNSMQAFTSGQETNKDINVPGPAPTKVENTGKALAGDEMEELKQMLKRILRALKKRMTDAPDNQAGATPPRREPGSASTGTFVDIKV